MNPDTLERLKQLTDDGDPDAAHLLLRHSYQAMSPEMGHTCCQVLAKAGVTAPVLSYCWSEIARLTCSKCNHTSWIETRLNTNTGIAVVPAHVCDCSLKPQNTKYLYDLAITIQDLDLCRQAMMLWWPYDLAKDQGWWRWFRDWVIDAEEPGNEYGWHGWRHGATMQHVHGLVIGLNYKAHGCDSIYPFPSMPELPAECICVGAGVERGMCPEKCDLIQWCPVCCNSGQCNRCRDCVPHSGGLPDLPEACQTRYC